MAADGIHEMLVTDDSIRMVSPGPSTSPAGLPGPFLPSPHQVCCTANSCHRSGTPLSWCTPRSAKLIPEPRTSICTVPVTSTSFAPARAATRALTWTARPAAVTPLRSTSPGMQASANLEADIPYGVPHGAGAPDGPGRPVEGGEEAVAGCVDLGAAEPVQQPADPGVMLVQQVSPAAVAEAAGCLRGPDDVGEQHGGQAAVEIRGPLHAGQELLDHVQQ